MPLDLPSNTQRLFEVHELFFSRTDKRGVIVRGNSVFQRVSGFEWDELLNAPHKVVRHPDMPKGLFYLLWEAIKAGEPICAYVCNSTKEGEAYWVLATIFPLEDGYLSMRLCPTSDMLDSIVPIYNAATKAERDEGLTPQQSAERIKESILDLGYSSFGTFEARALTAEMNARQRSTGIGDAAMLASITETLDGVRALEDCAETVRGVFKGTHQIPFNMRLQAGRVEGSDGPISVISGNHRMMSQGLETIVGKFSNSASETAVTLRAAALDVAFTQVIAEMKRFFETDKSETGDDKAELVSLMQGFLSNYEQTAHGKLLQTRQELENFQRQCRQMRRSLSGLELTRIMCKIERYRISGDQPGLDEIVSRLATSQKSLEKVSDEIEDVVVNILTITENMLRQRAAKAA